MLPNNFGTFIFVSLIAVPPAGKFAAVKRFYAVFSISGINEKSAVGENPTAPLLL
jgi:hypothetical protein